jgi:hypothetical protein
MNIWLRISDEQRSPRPPERYSATDTKVRFLLPGRFSGSWLLQADWVGGLSSSAVLPNRQKSAASNVELLKIERFSAKCAPISTRQWVKSRCYTKQRNKPRLTDTRTHISDLAFATFLRNKLGSANRERRPLENLVFQGHEPRCWCPPSLRKTYVTLARGDRLEWATSNASRVI